MRVIRYLISQLQEAHSNPNLRAIVHAQMHAKALYPEVQKEKACSLKQQELSKRDVSNKVQKSSPTRRRRSRVVGNPCQHARERSRDEAIDVDVVQDKESFRIVVGTLMKIYPQDNAIHNALLSVLESKGAVVQPTALQNQVMGVLTRGTLAIEEGDLLLLLLLHHTPQVLMVVHQNLSPKEGVIGVHIQHGSGHTAWRSLRKEVKMLPFFLMMVHMELRIKSLDLSKNLT